VTFPDAFRALVERGHVDAAEDLALLWDEAGGDMPSDVRGFAERARAKRKAPKPRPSKWDTDEILIERRRRVVG
jgi:hypothetical protein